MRSEIPLGVGPPWGPSPGFFIPLPPVLSIPPLAPPTSHALATHRCLKPFLLPYLVQAGAQLPSPAGVAATGLPELLLSLGTDRLLHGREACWGPTLQPCLHLVVHPSGQELNPLELHLPLCEMGRVGPEHRASHRAPCHSTSSMVKRFLLRVEGPSLCPPPPPLLTLPGVIWPPEEYQGSGQPPALQCFHGGQVKRSPRPSTPPPILTPSALASLANVTKSTGHRLHFLLTWPLSPDRSYLPGV
jgi:hypothetical protein